jgi:hypothetical protein
MCKIAVIPHIPEGNETHALELIEALRPHMTERDADGFGYMSVGDQGLYVERWLDVDQAFESRESTVKGLDSVRSLLDAQKQYSSHGKRSARIYSIAAHARMATCGVSLDNVHPFVTHDGTLALIHNGVISNVRDFRFDLSTCDSEAILQSLESAKVPLDFTRLQTAVDMLEGWYAVAAYSLGPNGWQLDLFKDARSSLYCAYVKEVGGPVFTTLPEHLEAACLDLGFTCSGMTEVKPCVAARFDITTGAIVAESKIVPRVPPVASVRVAEFNTLDPAPSYREDAEYSHLSDDDGPLDSYSYMTDPYGMDRRRKA